MQSPAQREIPTLHASTFDRMYLTQLDKWE